MADEEHVKRLKEGVEACLPAGARARLWGCAGPRSIDLARRTASLPDRRRRAPPGQNLAGASHALPNPTPGSRPRLGVRPRHADSRASHYARQFRLRW
jgi:hypothetical protein